MTKAIAMISGGLDSILAAKLIKEQGIEVIGICFKSLFFNEEHARRMVKQIDIPLEVIDFSKEHLTMVKNPKHGYGKNMNPCIDCHAMMMRYCGELLNKFKADFIITGEVLNQRPMSQNKSSLNLVKKESGVGHKVLRPLCALNLPATEMEETGLVDRSKLLNISGRNRKVQMELAKKWEIVNYPSPAGGCKLTEPNFSKRLRDLLKHNENPEVKDIELLRIGRHFRISSHAKIISTRLQEEAPLLKSALTNEDLYMLCSDFKGSSLAIVGEVKNEDLEFAARVAVRYSKGREEKRVKVKYGQFGNALDKTIYSNSATEDELKEYMI